MGKGGERGDERARGEEKEGGGKEREKEGRGRMGEGREGRGIPLRMKVLATAVAPHD